VSFPQGVPIFDGLVMFPGSLDRSPVDYLYKSGSPKSVGDPISYVLEGMDRFGVERAVVDVSGVGKNSYAEQALTKHNDRFVGLVSVDPNHGVDALREISRAIDNLGVVGVSIAPAICIPQVPINSNRAYPVYATCVEKDLTLFMLTGVPGPRVPMLPQKVELLDEVCSFFPDLRIVMRHGAEPWVDLAVKLMVKYPNLYYSTSAFTPKYYPEEIIAFVNSSRGRHKVIYAGHFAMGLTYEKIFGEMKDLALNEEAWPLFLNSNLESVLGIA